MIVSDVSHFLRRSINCFFSLYSPADFVDVRFPGARSHLQYTRDRFPRFRHAPGDVLDRELVVEQGDGAALAPQRHVVTGRVVCLLRTAPEQFGGTVVEHGTVVQAVAAQLARLFHCTCAHEKRDGVKTTGDR